ncbi:MAG: mechanosensitive ion channel family protein [Duncaniella sp.]|nr:mechanosensitive ion channel family protein [Duncaniella sp.]
MIENAEGAETPEVTPPTIELSAFKDMSFDQAINTIATDLAHFAISLFVAILVFYVGKFIINRLYGFTERILHRRNVDASLSTFVLSFVRIVLFFILIITVIGIVGIETTSFLALFASAGVAIGMALSGTLQNFAGGVLILALKPFKVGDYIEAQGFAGTVKKIEMFNTVITTADNKTIIIPNGGLSTGAVNNYATQPYRRVEWKVGISYGDSVEAARTAILAMLEARPEVLHVADDPESSIADPVVYVASLDDSAVTLSVRAWVRSGDYWGTFFAVNEEVYTYLPERAGISFPFPQLDVHVQKQ